MRIVLDRERKIILLKWLKQGYIDTLDLPEAYKDSSLFFELLKESGTDDNEAPEKGDLQTNNLT